MEQQTVGSRLGGGRALRLVYAAGLGLFAVASIAGLVQFGLHERALPGISSDPTLRSTAAIREGRLPQAAAELHAFEAIVPRGNPSILEQARIYAALGEPKRAFNAYRRAANTLPNSAKAQAHFGAELFARRRFEEAAGAFERVVALNPGYPSARKNLAVAYLNSGRTEESIEQFELALEGGETAEVHEMLSRAHEMLGRHAPALEHAQRALQLDPGSDERRRRVDEMKRNASRSRGGS